MKLLSSQKKQILSVFQGDFGFKTREFEITEDTPNSFIISSSTKIVYKANPRYFVSIVSAYTGKTSVQFSPGKNTIDESYDVANFVDIAALLYKWGGYLKKEVDADDILLKMMEDVNGEGFNFGDVKDVFFNEGEKQQIKVKINELKVNITNINLLNPSELKVIEDRLTDLTNKVDKLSKFDWRTFCIGTFVSIIMQLALSQETGKTLWRLFHNFITSRFLLQ